MSLMFTVISCKWASGWRVGWIHGPHAPSRTASGIVCPMALAAKPIRARYNRPVIRASSTGSEAAHRRIYAVVRRIPKGYVATYGQVAELAELPRAARLVGRALSVLPEGTRVPWHRV